MIPLPAVGVVGLILAGMRGKSSPKRSRNAKKKTKAGHKQARVRKGVASFTAFPWDADRVSEIGTSLCAKGDIDIDRLTIACAKMCYPVHPTTGEAFDWENCENDVGASLILNRIRLRMTTVHALHDERIADDAASQAVAEPSEPTVLAEEVVVVESPEGEGEIDSDSEPDAVSMTIGRQTQTAQAATPAVAMVSDQPKHGCFWQVTRGVTIHDAAKQALILLVEEPSEDHIAQYVSLIVSSPENNLRSVWDDARNIPGSEPFPWGHETPMLWLPLINEEKLHKGVVTTLGANWPDGSSGITPPRYQQ